MALELSQQRLNVSGSELRRTQQSRSEVTAEGEPGGLHVLRGVEGIGAGDALAPTLAVVGLHADQQGVTDRLGPERRAER